MASRRLRFIVAMAPLLLLIPLTALVLTLGVPKAIIAGAVYISTPSGKDITFWLRDFYGAASTTRLERVYNIWRVAMAITSAIVF